MTTKKTVSGIKRNLALLSDITNAKAVRVAYKTEAGWKRLRIPASASASLRQAALRSVEARLDCLMPIAVRVAVDQAIASLAAEIGD